jgi:hypothetical protein
MSSPTPLSAAETALHRLLWDTRDSLASWACGAATAVLKQLPPNYERSGYRHDVSHHPDGVVAHELVELDSSLPVCLVYEWADGSRLAAFCQPWPAILARFINAIIDGDLLVGADATRSDPVVVR